MIDATIGSFLTITSFQGRAVRLEFLKISLREPATGNPRLGTEVVICCALWWKRTAATSAAWTRADPTMQVSSPRAWGSALKTSVSLQPGPQRVWGYPSGLRRGRSGVSAAGPLAEPTWVPNASQRKRFLGRTEERAHASGAKSHRAFAASLAVTRAIIKRLPG